MTIKKKKPRSLKQNLIWRGGGMLGHLGCGKANIKNAELAARQILALLINNTDDIDDLEELTHTRQFLIETCQDLSLVLSRFNRVVNNIHSSAQEQINRIPKNDNTPSL